MLSVENVTVVNGRVTAVREASFSVNEGEIVTLIGSNGAGKSTMLNAIAGYIPLRSGNVWLHDKQLSGLAPHQMAEL